MTPAEEKARLASVQLALETLLAGGPKTRAELFGEAKTQALREFQRRTLRTLEQQGIVYKAEAGVPPQMKVHLKNRRKAQNVLEDPTELAIIVWPGSKPAPPPGIINPPAPQEPVAPVVYGRTPPQEKPAFVVVRRLGAVDDSPKEPPKEEPVPFVVPAPVPTPQTDPTTQKQMDDLLMVMHAACQSIIYMREKLDALEPKINHLWEQLK